eukprot:jgi/Botrbrau1/21380/Bobra.0216s0002.1
MVQSAVGTPAHPSQIAGTFSPPFGAGNSAPPQVASTPAQAVPRTSYPAVASSIPAATSLHPATGFDELLASVGLSLMDKDYSLATPAPRFAECSSVPTLQQNLFHSSAGATVGSTIPDPLSAYTTGRSLASPPVQPGASAITGQPPGHHLGLPAGSHVAMQQVLEGLQIPVDFQTQLPRFLLHPPRQIAARGHHHLRPASRLSHCGVHMQDSSTRPHGLVALSPSLLLHRWHLRKMQLGQSILDPHPGLYLTWICANQIVSFEIRCP